MHFESFTLKADHNNCGRRQLVDLSEDATVRFAEVGFGKHGVVDKITVTYSHITGARRNLVPRALYVVDPRMIPSGGEVIEDVRSFHDGHGSRRSFPEGSTSVPVRFLVEVAGFLVFQAVA